MTKLFKISLDARFTWIVRGPTPTISIVSYGSPDVANLQETPSIILMQHKWIEALISLPHEG